MGLTRPGNELFEDFEAEQNATGSFSLDCSTGSIFLLKLTGATTLSLSNVPSDLRDVDIRIKQDSGGGKTLAWDTSVFRLPDATAPDMTTDANKWQWFSARRVPGDTKFDVISVSGVYT
jgi:hypothetical protein